MGLCYRRENLFFFLYLTYQWLHKLRNTQFYAMYSVASSSGFILKHTQYIDIDIIAASCSSPSSSHPDHCFYRNLHTV